MAQKIPCKNGDLYWWNEEAAEMQNGHITLRDILNRTFTKFNDFNKLNLERIKVVYAKLFDINKAYYEMGEDGKVKLDELTKKAIFKEGKTDEARQKEIQEYFAKDNYYEY